MEFWLHRWVCKLTKLCGIGYRFLKTEKNHIGFVICLETGPSFGKSQLLNAPTLANQNKNKIARNFRQKEPKSFDFGQN